MITTKSIGDYGEQIAKAFLIKNGYSILETNFRGKSGEIDIIAKQRDFLVFVEVKTRKNDTYILAREAVTPAKQKKIRSTAREFVFNNKINYKFIRFDVIEFYTQDQKIDHYVNAF